MSDILVLRRDVFKVVVRILVEKGVVDIGFILVLNWDNRGRIVEVYKKIRVYNEVVIGVNTDTVKMKNIGDSEDFGIGAIVNLI